MARVVANGNQKGGVGKSSSAVNEAAVLAAKGKRVLLIDMDPQGNATRSCGVEAGEKTIYEVFTGEAVLTEAVQGTEHGFDIVTAATDLAGAEMQIQRTSDMAHFKVLKHAIDTVRNFYDFIVLDLPPSLGFLTINGLVAATDLLVPIQAEILATDGAKELIRTIGYVTQEMYDAGDGKREPLNPDLKIAAFMTMFTPNFNLCKLALEEAEQHFGEHGIPILETKIKRSVRFGEAPYVGVPAVIAAKDTPAVQDYFNLVEEALGV